MEYHNNQLGRNGRVITLRPSSPPNGFWICPKLARSGSNVVRAAGEFTILIMPAIMLQLSLSVCLIAALPWRWHLPTRFL